MRLETPRCVLRPLEPQDASALHAAFGDAEVMAYWNSPAFPALADTEAMIERQLSEVAAGSHLYWSVELRETGAVAGCCDLSDIDVAAGEAEVGFIFVRTAWGAGHAREAASAVTAYAWSALGLSRLTALVQGGNGRSEALLRALGFEASGAPGKVVLRAGEARRLDLWTLDRPA